MEHMTSDMSGAAVVVATVITAAALQLPVAVTAWAALAENLPSGSSYRPGDVIRHYGANGGPGKTVHVLNTDAEGRLVLADAIVRAAEEQPDYLLDTATLTGAQVVALGNRTMAVMGTDDLRDRVAELAREVGEGGWAMPLPEELRDSIDSTVADLQNINWDRVGGMLVAGHFLRCFVPDGLPWAHLDVAGPAFNTGKPYGYNASGGTGVPLRTLVAVLESIAAE
jgi:leucyl aminopeptidase